MSEAPNLSTEYQKASKVEMKPWNECSPQERIERWENVVRVLESLTPHEREKHFDMGDWGNKTPCGTVACAAGHCGLDPWFQSRGFAMTFELIDEGDEDNDPWWDTQIDDPEYFFGEEGTERVFYNVSDSFDEVLENVKGYVSELKQVGTTV